MKKKMNYNLPTYEIVVEDDDNSGMRFLSIVENPAIEMKGHTFATKRYDLQPFDENSRFHTHPNCKCSFTDGEWAFEPTPDGIYPCDICKEMKNTYTSWYSKKGSGASSAPSTKGFSANEEQQMIVGPAMIPDRKIYRNDDGVEYYVTFSADTIKKIVQKFVKENNNRSINVEHSNQMVQAYIQEHWIVKDSVYDASKYYGFDLPVGSWFVCMKIEDKNFWTTDVKELGKYGFSIEGILGQRLVSMSGDFGNGSDLPDGNKVSFDYHGVLNTPKGMRKAKELIDNGYDVHIVTNANKNQSGHLISAAAKELGLPESKIHYAEGNKPKVLADLGIDTHYDNNPTVINKVNEAGNTDAIKFNDDEMEKVINTLTEEEIKYLLGE
jgi:hypothetical protein